LPDSLFAVIFRHKWIMLRITEQYRAIRNITRARVSQSDLKHTVRKGASKYRGGS
jgi:hypothetical protein